MNRLYPHQIVNLLTSFNVNYIQIHGI